MLGNMDTSGEDWKSSRIPTSYTLAAGGSLYQPRLGRKFGSNPHNLPSCWLRWEARISFNS